MKLIWIVMLTATAAMAGSAADKIDGRWKVRFAGVPSLGPKTVGSIVLDLKTAGDNVTGSVRIGVWPGEAPLADGKVTGNHVSFNAAGRLSSTTGIPTCHFEVTINNDEMDLAMTVTHNPGGPLEDGAVYEYRGGKEPETAGGEESAGTKIMPAAQQNAVVQRYCASCHSDALLYGALSLEHFDAARLDPSLAAMLVSKLTSGRTPADINAAAHGPDSELAILRLAKGAMGAAGDGVPDEATQAAFAKALSVEAAGAEAWHSQWNERPTTQLTTSILRELPSTVFGGKTDMYRLTLTCRVETHEGEIQVAWANGVPDEGREMTVEVDGKAPFTHKVDGGNKQGNGLNGPGATLLYSSAGTKMPFPAQSMTIGNLFPNESVVFPFEKLSDTVRRDLSACFKAY